MSSITRGLIYQRRPAEGFASALEVMAEEQMCRELAQKHGIEIEDDFDDRAPLHKLIGNFNKPLAVIVYSWMQYVRTAEHAHIIQQAVYNKKCRILSVAEGIDTDEDTKMLSMCAWVMELQDNASYMRLKRMQQMLKLDV